MKNKFIIVMFLFIGSVLSKKINGQTWENLGTGVSGCSTCFVRALAVYNGELYAGGTFTDAGGVSVNNIARWNGTFWSDVGTGVNNEVLALTVYNGELYVGGSFTTAGGIIANNIAKWNGTSWSNVGTGSGMSNGVFNTGLPIIHALTVYNGELYAGGEFDSINGNLFSPDVAKWDGLSWSAVGQGTTIIDAFAVYNGELYMGPGDLSQMIKWNGTSLSLFGDVNYNGIRVLYNYNGDLLSSEDVHSNYNNITYIKKLNGTSWDTLCTVNNLSTFSEYITTLIGSNSQLYAGAGDFSIINGRHVSTFFRYDGTSWWDASPHGDLDNGVDASVIYNSELYVGGAFVYAYNYNNMLALNKIAKLKPCSSHFTLHADTVPHNWIALNESAGIPPLTYTWSWGDGSPNSTGATPSHLYNTAGTYTICQTVTDGSGCTEMYCNPSVVYRNTSDASIVTINVVDSSTLITSTSNQLLKTDDITIYPNPSNGRFYLNNKNNSLNKIRVYNTLNKLIYERNITSRIIEEIDLSSQPDGMYVLQLFVEGKMYCRKLLKE